MPTQAEFGFTPTLQTGSSSLHRIGGWMRCQRTFNPFHRPYSAKELNRWAKHLGAHPADVLKAFEQIFFPTS